MPSFGILNNLAKDCNAHLFNDQLMNKFHTSKGIWDC